MAAPPPANSRSTSSTNCCCSGISPKRRPIFDLLSNIRNLLPMKADCPEFAVWRYQMDTILRAHNLIGYVDGSLKCPPKFIVQDSTTGKVVDPAYEIWCMEDGAVMAGINATLSFFELQKVQDCSTARQLWLELHEIYNSFSYRS